LFNFVYKNTRNKELYTNTGIEIILLCDT